MILFRFARFGRSGGFVSVVSAVSLVSFWWFCFVVSGFSTCCLVACKFIDLRQDAAINNKRDSVSRNFFRGKV